MIIARHNDDDQVIYLAGRWLVVVDFDFAEPRVAATADNGRAADLTAGMRDDLLKTARRIMAGERVTERDFDRLGEHIDDCQEPACCGGRDRYCPCTPRGLGREL